MKNIISTFKQNKLLLLAFFISALTYILFFYKVLTPKYGFWGSDMVTEYYPARAYLYKTIVNEHRFPFWTEKEYAGFPIYADMENSYLNIPNVVTLLIFGPMLSYKVLHVVSYLVGSMALYLFLKRKKVNIVGYFIANLAFYFCFFMLNHQVHLGIMMIVYLTPLHFLLLDYYIEKKSLKYILLQALALANAVLWGHIQFPVIIIFGLVLYALMHIRQISVKQFFLYFLIVGVLTAAFSAPLLIPNYNLYKNGYRDGGVSSLQGSLMPNAASVFAYPFIFDKWDWYTGYTVGFRFTYTEIYNYVGISILLISALAFLFLKRDRLYYFSYSLIWLLILLAFMTYEPLRNLHKAFIINMFRYWERTVFLTSFGLAVMCAKFVSDTLEKFSIKEFLIRLGLVVLPIIYLNVLTAVYFKTPPNGIQAMSKYFSSYKYVLVHTVEFKQWTYIVGATLILGVAMIITKYLKKQYAMVFVILLGVVVLADFSLFSKDVLHNRILNITKIEDLPHIPAYFNKDRIIAKVGVEGLQYLYFDAWSPFGYSNFFKENYAQLMNRVGISNYKHLMYKSANELKDVTQYSVLGVVGTYSTELNKKTALWINQDPNTDLLTNISSGSSYVLKEEGHIIMDVKNNNQPVIFTYLKSDPCWKLYIDGIESPIDKKDVFMNFMLRNGTHRIEFKYVPYLFYEGLALLAGVSAIFIWQYKNIQKIIK